MSDALRRATITDRAEEQSQAVMRSLLRSPDSPYDLLLNPHNPLRPPEWGPIPEEIMVTIAPEGALVMTPESRASMNRLALGEWFVVKNFDGAYCEACRPGGYGSRSRILGEKHPWVTVECIPSPFNGLRQILWWMEDVERRNEYKPGTMMDRLKNYTTFRPPDDCFVPISAADAAALMGQIKQRGGRPVIEQCPPRLQDLDADLIRRRIATNARRWRDLGLDAA